VVIREDQSIKLPIEVVDDVQVERHNNTDICDQVGIVDEKLDEGICDVPRRRLELDDKLCLGSHALRRAKDFLEEGGAETIL
jgi:hypothetical protein